MKTGNASPPPGRKGCRVWYNPSAMANTDILSFGAAGDGATLCTKPIQAAIDACAASGGGTVTVPPGVFLTGTLYLRSHVNLRLEHAATLRGSPDLADDNPPDAYPQNFDCAVSEGWNARHLVIAAGVEDVALSGTGTIDGNGRAFFARPETMPPPGEISWRRGFLNAADRKNAVRPGQTVVFVECRDVSIADVSLVDATCWTLFLHGCDRVRVRGLSIRSDDRHANTDGIDIDCCRHVTVSDCVIDTGDDAITLRGDCHHLGDPSRVCEDIAVANCVSHTACCGVRIGVGTGAIRDAVFSNLVMCDAGYGIQIQCGYGRSTTKGADISGLRFENIVCRRTAVPLRICAGTGHAKARLEDIVVAHCSLEGFFGVEIAGNALMRPRGIRLHDVDFAVCRPDVPLRLEKMPESFIRVDKADDIAFDGVRIGFAPDAGRRPALALGDVGGIPPSIEDGEAVALGDSPGPFIVYG